MQTFDVVISVLDEYLDGRSDLGHVIATIETVCDFDPQNNSAVNEACRRAFALLDDIYGVARQERPYTLTVGQTDLARAEVRKLRSVLQGEEEARAREAL